MKRVDAIAKGKAKCLTDIFKRKSNRILRSVQQAIDFAEDKISETADKAEEILESFGSYAESTQTSCLQSRINAYCDAVAEADEWQKQLVRLQDLEKMLKEEVELDEA